jgi:hypothetical protein
MPRFDPATPLVLPLPDPDRAELRPGLAYASADGRELAMDLYLPAGRAPGPPPFPGSRSRCAAPPSATAPPATSSPPPACRPSWSSGPGRTTPT